MYADTSVTRRPEAHSTIPMAWVICVWPCPPPAIAGSA